MMNFDGLRLGGREMKRRASAAAGLAALLALAAAAGGKKDPAFESALGRLTERFEADTRVLASDEMEGRDVQPLPGEVEGPAG